VAARPHHHVYVVYLRNPKADGRAGYYVGMTGLTPEERFANHKNGIKSAGVVKRCGERLVPKLYAHLNPMTYEQAAKMEQQLAAELRAAGYQVFGGH
jgi:predicted GIY-YIG superfamily endonuclease